MNYILGSGVVALLAKLLFPSWKIIPFGKSRFYSFKTPIADNILIRDDELDQFILKYINAGAPILYPYNIGYSINGQLINKYDKLLCDAWVGKAYGNDIPSQAYSYYKFRSNFNVYDLRVTTLYQSLMERFKDDIISGINLGQVSEIKPGAITINNNTLQYDNIISTIPLNILLKLMNSSCTLTSRHTQVAHIRTTELDLEGNNQVRVVDNTIDFYKVSQIAPDRYLFYFNNELPNPGLYLSTYVQSFDMLDCTTVENYTITGEIPKLDVLEKNNIYCAGSYAQWDDCLDVTSCIKRLLTISRKL